MRRKKGYYRMTKLDFSRKESYRIDDLLRIMEMLRGEGGCPWDREQDHHSIRNNFIEETYEAVEAIDTDDSVLLREELGDVLLQVVFHSCMESEAGRFTFDDVCDGICKKLIHRHPHIFGDVIATSSEEVLDNWDSIKREEKQQETAVSTLEAVSRALPSLVRSSKVQKRASKFGYDYPDVKSALDSLKDEIEELEQAISQGSQGEVGNEIGDVLFSAVNVSRLLKQNPEELLYCSTDRFIRRFGIAEELVKEQGGSLEGCNPDELDALWRKAKAQEH